MTEMQIRLRCLKRECRFEFVRPESIVDLGAEAYMREKACPKCRCDATTLADVQPRPGLWWSKTEGLVQQLPRRVVGDEPRFKVGYNRVTHRLPEDAVPLAPVPDRGDDEQREARQRAADRVSAYLERWEKVAAVDRPKGLRDDAVVDGSLGSVALAVADLRLLVQAAPPLPPKWSGLTADPTVYIVQETGEDWTDAAIRARALIAWAREHAPDVDEIFRHDAVVLSIKDLETLCDLNGNIMFVGFDRARAEALADGERTTLMWTTVHR
jgi:hypothetical protein